MKVQRCNFISENEIGIIEDMDTLIHNIVTPELKELQQENKQLKEEIEEYKRIEQEDLIAFNNYDSILNELKAYILNHHIVGHTILNATLDDILKKLKELKEKYK